MERALVAALVDCLMFIELSPDSVIDPDAAVQAHEQVAAQLQALPAHDQQRLIAHMAAIAEAAEPDRREFLAALPDALGLTQ